MGDIEDIIRDLERNMEIKGVSRGEIAKRLGLHRSTVTNFFNRSRVNAGYNEVSRYFSAIGMELRAVDK